MQANGCDLVPVQNGFENDAGSISAKWQSTCGHLIEHHTERKQVRARIQWCAAHLFRRHVGDRAHCAAGTGEQFLRSGSWQSGDTGSSGYRGELRQTEIQNLGVTSLSYEQVRGLDIAVDDAFRVCGFEGVGNLDSPVK